MQRGVGLRLGVGAPQPPAQLGEELGDHGEPAAILLLERHLAFLVPLPRAVVVGVHRHLILDDIDERLLLRSGQTTCSQFRPAKVTVT